MNKLIFDIDFLYMDDSTTLIVCKETGVFYDMQVGGVACYHKIVEGFPLLLPEKFSDFNDCSFGCQYISQDKKLQQALSKELDNHLAFNSEGLTFSVRFDFDRVDELMEGLWPVQLSGRYFDTDVNGLKGFIYAFNCD